MGRGISCVMSALWHSIHTSGLIAYRNRLTRMSHSTCPSPHPLWRNPAAMAGRRVCSCWQPPRRRSRRESAFQFHIERASPKQRFRSPRSRQPRRFWSEWIRSSTFASNGKQSLQQLPFAAARAVGCRGFCRLLGDPLKSETELS